MPQDSSREPVAPAFGAPSQRSLRIDRARSVLVVVDVQQRLAPAVAGADTLLRRTLALLAAASHFAVPRIATLHCPERIGALVPALAAQMTTDEQFAKTRFCATDHPAFLAKLARSARTQVIVAGMEAHVCVLQTALGLVEAHYEVFVVADAVGSRATRQQDRDLALARLRDAGVALASTETVLFEWTGDADDAAFRDILKLVKDLPG